MSDATEEYAGQYVTEAVESVVRTADREVVGHVGLLDLDDVPAADVRDLAERLPGPSAVLRSSERSHHVWTLAVDGLEAWTARLERLDLVDQDHVALSAHRDCGVLRLDAKVAMSTGEEVAPAPSLVDVVETPTDLPASVPHARILRDDLGADLEPGSDGREWVGHSTRRRAYIAEIRGAE